MPGRNSGLWEEVLFTWRSRSRFSTILIPWAWDAQEILYLEIFLLSLLGGGPVHSLGGILGISGGWSSLCCLPGFWEGVPLEVEESVFWRFSFCHLTGPLQISSFLCNSEKATAFPVLGKAGRSLGLGGAISLQILRFPTWEEVLHHSGGRWEATCLPPGILVLEFWNFLERVWDSLEDLWEGLEERGSLQSLDLWDPGILCLPLSLSKMEEWDCLGPAGMPPACLGSPGFSTIWDGRCTHLPGEFSAWNLLLTPPGRFHLPGGGGLSACLSACSECLPACHSLHSHHSLRFYVDAWRSGRLHASCLPRGEVPPGREAWEDTGLSSLEWVHI